MPSKNSILIAVGCVALLLVGVAGYSRVAESSLNGMWLRSAGYPHPPHAIRVVVANGKFKTSFPVPYGDEVETVTLDLDGREHIWSDPIGHFGYGAQVTYSALLNGSTVDLTTHVRYSATPEWVNVEHWSLTDGGRQMVVTNPKLIVSSTEDVIKYDRAPVTRSLFTRYP